MPDDATLAHMTRNEADMAFKRRVRTIFEWIAPQDDDLILDGTLDFDISPNETKTNDPSTSNPSTGSNPKPPATSGVPYPDSTNPGSSDPVPNRPTTETVETPVPPGYHRVVKGDTLYRLSKLYNTTVARLKEVNNLGSDNIQIGQVLKVK